MLLAVLVMLMVWCADTVAYFAGRIIGGPKLAPRISPKKTWEGFAGGGVAALLGGLLLGWLVVLAPLAALVWFVAFRSGPPDFKALPPVSIAAFAVLGVATVIASFSIAVNWNRRILAAERKHAVGCVHRRHFSLDLNHALEALRVIFPRGQRAKSWAFAKPLFVVNDARHGQASPVRRLEHPLVLGS